MEYYRCTKVDLHQELTRRGYEAYGDQDVAAERLKKDEEERGSGATTVNTVAVTLDEDAMWKVDSQFGMTVPANRLIGIVHWVMGTFFPTLQLFFSSGFSCTIDGSQLPGAVVTLDPALRYRLTDIQHEEDGNLVNTIMSTKFATKSSSIGILEATMASRTSIAVMETHEIASAQPVTTIAQEQHIVVGLRLEGMMTMGYIWAKVPDTTVQIAGRMWGHVRVSGLRKDMPIPFVRFPQPNVQPGARTMVVNKGSMIGAKKEAANGSSGC